ncbi:unnamed protein product [Blepharisma stoltei]|uniref:C2H2-type domain-containing protein n=1 Tax=Blepharisma stoltei TaxID=1481888 RepID=A0AAU9JEU5_9CILI|nr:unnamed protein product [Blepharisma stoltei]
MKPLTPQLLFECRNCKLKFENPEQLANHTSKFCKDSDYGSPSKIKQKLEESRLSKNSLYADSVPNIDEVKSYLRDDIRAKRADEIGSTTLEELRGRVRNNERQFEKVADHIMSQKEQDLKNDILKLRFEKIENQAKRQIDETIYSDVMNELEGKRNREIRAKADKDQISWAIRDYDRKNLGTGDAGKRNNLLKLEEDRENLRVKENDLWQEIENFQRKMVDDERLWQAEKDRLSLENRGESVKINMELMQKKQMEMARARAIQLQQLSKKKQMIDLERDRIMDDLNQIKKGDYGTIRKNSAGKLVASTIIGTPLASADRKNIPNNLLKLNDKWQEDYERLNQLKKDHEDFIQKDQAKPFDFAALEGKNKYSRENSAKSITSPRIVQPVVPYQRPMIPNFGGNDLQYPYVNNMPRNNQYNPYQPGYPNYPPSNPYMSPPYPPPGNPYFPQPSNQFTSPTMTSPAEDKAMTSLKKELKKIKKKLNSKDHDEFYTGMQNAINEFQNRINTLERAPGNNEVQSEDLLPEERALNNVINQEHSELKLLSALPKNSELYQAKLEHYKEMSQIRARMEAMLQELSMERMKKNFDREMELKERKLMNDKWLEEQKRGVIMNKLGIPMDQRDFGPTKQYPNDNLDRNPPPFMRSKMDLDESMNEPNKAPFNPQPQSRNTRPRSLGTAGSVLNPISNHGFAVRLENLLNFLSKSHLKFQVTIQEDEKVAKDSNGNDCRWSSEIVNALADDPSPSPSIGNKRIPGTKIWADKSKLKASDINNNAMQNAALRNPADKGHNIIEINKETQFMNNFYIMLEQADWQMSYYLVVEIFERVNQGLLHGQNQNFKPTGPDNFLPVAWTVFQLTNSDSRALNFGTIELNLYHYPVAVPLYDPALLRQKEGTLKLTVFEPTTTRLDTNSRAQSLGSVHRPGSLASFKPPQKIEPFLENQTPQLTDIRYFDKGDGVDFYVDGARFFPDNISCSKIIVKAFTSNLEKVEKPVGGLPDLNSSAYSPSYCFRTEFRKQIFDPTTTIVISILTIDTQHSEVRVLGYAAINMFINKFRRDQPDNPNEQDFILNKGHFQIPIYCQEPYRKPPFGISAFRKLEIIPCATLLVRIREAPKADSGLRVLSTKDVLPNEWYSRGLVVPPPRYEERIYNTSECMPTTIERYLYEERVNRRDITVRDATAQTQNQMGIRLDQTDDEMLEWIDQKLQVTPRTPMIDMKYFAKYLPKMGFKFSVDAIHNIPTESPHVAVFCLNPPGALYSNTVITQDVNFTIKVDWNSSITTPRFLDGFHNYRNVLFDRNMHIIIDIRAVSFAKQKPEVVDVGWTILPVFSEDGYINSGIYQLPLFKGSVPAPFMSELTNNSPWEHLMRAAQRSGGPQYLDPVSVIVRLVDSQRDGHFMMPMETQRMNYDYVPESLRGKMSYNAAAEEMNMHTRRLKAMIPGNYTSEHFLRKINETIADHLGLSHAAS